MDVIAIIKRAYEAGANQEKLEHVEKEILMKMIGVNAYDLSERLQKSCELLKSIKAEQDHEKSQ